MQARRSRVRSGTSSSIRGLLMHAIVHSADIQDRDGGALLMANLFRRLSVPDQALADGGYQGPEFQSAMERILARVTVKIVKHRIKPQVSSRCPSAGSSNAPSHGSAAAEDWPRTGNASTTGRSPFCVSPLSASCCENYAIAHNVIGQTLRCADPGRMVELIPRNWQYGHARWRNSK